MIQLVEVMNFYQFFCVLMQLAITNFEVGKTEFVLFFRKEKRGITMMGSHQ